MWTFGLHGGARFSMSATSVLTPYLNFDYVSAKMDEFIETGLDGAEPARRRQQGEQDLAHGRCEVGDPDRRRGSGG